jgi:hypothetical protein
LEGGIPPPAQAGGPLPQFLWTKIVSAGLLAVIAMTIHVIAILITVRSYLFYENGKTIFYIGTITLVSIASLLPLRFLRIPLAKALAASVIAQIIALLVAELIFHTVLDPFLYLFVSLGAVLTILFATLGTINTPKKELLIYGILSILLVFLSPVLGLFSGLLAWTLLTMLVASIQFSTDNNK